MPTGGRSEGLRCGPPVFVRRTAGLFLPSPQKSAFLPCGHLDFESAVTVRNDEFKAVLIAQNSRLLKVKT